MLLVTVHGTWLTGLVSLRSKAEVAVPVWEATSVFLCSLRILPEQGPFAEFRFKLSIHSSTVCASSVHGKCHKCLIGFRSYFQVKVTIISFVNLLQWPMNLDNVLFKLCFVFWLTAPGKQSACISARNFLKYLCTLIHWELHKSGKVTSSRNFWSSCQQEQQGSVWVPQLQLSGLFIRKLCRW